MPHLHRLSEISNRHSEDFQDAGMYNPVGSAAYLTGGQTLGTVRDALVDDTHGRIRYLMVDSGGSGGDLQGARLIPIGLARLEDDGVYFDDLTASQLSAMHRYSADEEYTFDLQSQDERVLRGQMDSQTGGEERVLHAAQPTAATAAATSYNYRDEDTSDRMFKGSPRLQLLEERLSVNKEKYRAGSVEIGKHVETHQESVAVPLQREEVVIERHAVTDARPVQGDVIGGGHETVRVELEAERAQVAKQAYVTEEIEVGKRTVTEQQTVTETVGREVLDVNQTGDVELLSDENGRRNNRD